MNIAPNRFRLMFPVVLCLSFSCLLSKTGVGEGNLGPLKLVASPDHATLFVAFHDDNALGVLDLETQALVGRVELPGPPTSLAIDETRHTLFVSCGSSESMVCAIDLESMQIKQRYGAGHGAGGLTIDADRQWLIVCNRFDNDVSIIDLASGDELARVDVVREPCATAIAPDTGVVFVVNHLPLDPADSGDVAAEVSVIVPQVDQPGHFETKSIRLLNGSTSCRDIVISPDEKWAFVSHTLARYQLPTTQLDRGWMNTNAISVIDVQRQTLLNTVLLDGIDSGAATPWGMEVTADGKTLCVTHAGSHEVSVIDVDAVTTFLRQAEPTPVAKDIANDLSLLHGKRRRISLSGDRRYLVNSLQNPAVGGPRDIAIVGSKAFVACYFTDNLAIVDLEENSRNPVKILVLNSQLEMTQARIGEMLFNDARICFQHWQSCASCHPDGRVDGLNWDLLNDGLGNGNNVKSMLLVDRTAPMMISGVRADAEQAVRSGIRHSLFTVRPQEDIDAIMAYLKSIEPVPSPHLEQGRLSQAASRGKELFFSDRVGCYRCHPEPLYTDQQMHNVGTAREDSNRSTFDTPTLIECWRTAPYMHDGRYTTLQQVFQEGNHGLSNNSDHPLTRQELNDLTQFILSL